MKDTSAEAEEVQLGIIRKMSGSRRLEIALEMCSAARELSRTRVRQLHPDWTERRIDKELLRLAFLPGTLPGPLR